MDDGYLDNMDYLCFLRYKGFEDSPNMRAAYDKSGRKGKFEGILSRKRRRLYGPGTFWAESTGGVYLNKRRRQINGQIP